MNERRELNIFFKWNGFYSAYEIGFWLIFTYTIQMTTATKNGNQPFVRRGFNCNFREFYSLFDYISSLFFCVAADCCCSCSLCKHLFTFLSWVVSDDRARYYTAVKYLCACVRLSYECMCVCIRTCTVQFRFFAILIEIADVFVFLVRHFMRAVLSSICVHARACVCVCQWFLQLCISHTRIHTCTPQADTLRAYVLFD